MKKQLPVLFAIILGTLTVNAQKPDSAQAMVHYKFSWLRDTTRRDKPYTENMILFVGQNASVYKSYDKKLQAELMKKQMQEQIASGSHQFKFDSRGDESTTTEYFQFPNENKLVRKESLISSYLIDEPFPVIKWKISADTSTIGNLHCQKATAHFKGRNYTAWFCTELPYRSGPWKLNGLPGLIVEAYDTKKEVVFKFDGIDPVVKTNKAAAVAAPTPGVRSIIMIGGDDPNADPDLIALPDNAVKATEKEFDNLQDAMRKDPNAFMQSALAGSGMNIKLNTNMKVESKIINGPDVLINNPIELPEKK